MQTQGLKDFKKAVKAARHVFVGVVMVEGSDPTYIKSFKFDVIAMASQQYGTKTTDDHEAVFRFFTDEHGDLYIG